MKSEEIYKLIKQAQTENNSMAAYNIFLTHLDVVNRRVASIFRDTPEACEDWTRDEFLRLALKKLRTIRKPESWKSFLSIAVCNRAKSKIRSTLLQFTSLDSVRDEPMGINECEPVKHDKLYQNISYRDRAILKLSYGIEPSGIEWQALSLPSGRSVSQLQNDFKKYLDILSIEETKGSDKLFELSNNLLILHRKQNYLKTKLDWLCLQNPTDEIALQQASEELQKCLKSHRYQYTRYQKLQKPQRRKIRAAILAEITMLSVNDIHKIISRARRKIKVNLS